MNATGLSPNDADVAALGPWFHNLHLPDGTQTCPDHWAGDFPSFKWQQLAAHVPEDLSGWSCLDIGCNAGFYTFELARRGARVLGIDVDARYLQQAGWAARRFGSDVESRVRFEQMQVYDLARLPEGESFDLVLFMGVLYHLRYPMLGLDLVCQRVRRLLVFQTLTTPGDTQAGGAEHRLNRGVVRRPPIGRVARKMVLEERHFRPPGLQHLVAVVEPAAVRVQFDVIARHRQRLKHHQPAHAPRHQVEPEHRVAQVVENAHEQHEVERCVAEPRQVVHLHALEPHAPCHVRTELACSPSGLAQVALIKIDPKDRCAPASELKRVKPRIAPDVEARPAAKVLRNVRCDLMPLEGGKIAQVVRRVGLRPVGQVEVVKPGAQRGRLLVNGGGGCGGRRFGSGGGHARVSST